MFVLPKVFLFFKKQKLNKHLYDLLYSNICIHFFRVIEI